MYEKILCCKIIVHFSNSLKSWPCVCGVLKSFCNLISPEDQASGLFFAIGQTFANTSSLSLLSSIQIFFKHIMLSISLLVKIKSKSKCHLKFKFAFILSFKLYTDGDCIKKNYAQQALTDCKPFYIRNSTRYFFELEEIKGLGKKVI